MPREKVLQKVQKDQEKKLASYKETVCCLEENNQQMLEKINILEETVALYKNVISLIEMKASEV